MEIHSDYSGTELNREILGDTIEILDGHQSGVWIEVDTAREQMICMRCGACCASFRVSFYWSETDVYGIADGLVEQITPLMLCMAGTNRSDPRCMALTGAIGSAVSCSIYPSRPSPCRHVRLGDQKCVRARQVLHITNEDDAELWERGSITAGDAQNRDRQDTDGLKEQ